ncbi:hypothetical protein SAMN04488073_0938 [Marinobacter gudaonensis]|uniref:CDP-Glycerol:Poly(Glycerophosphate) glycerophosphotransferase n=1 Tax=Marinobacter gudaonensis TaxID=375760 RepID=A0A1I6GJ22_9GAMM|nr:hypothetical protein [Marinobacter gudaonensis]SFR42223.1 hypothetical protein SAMN04488073_0938 [Marinobacter gudaonensis]
MNFVCSLRLLLKGLNRNFKIINFGDVPDVYKVHDVMERYSYAQPRSRGVLRSFKELSRIFLKPTVKVYTVPNVPVIYCGGSKNNEREFSFFSKMCSKKIQMVGYARDANLSFVSAKELRKTFIENVFSFSALFVCFFYLFKIKLNPISFKYLSTFGKVYLQTFISFYRLKSLPRVLVVANDHTDFPVAASMVMQYFGVPVIYVQHAEVSPSFPPLDFSVSVLRNEKSLQVYKRCGDVLGDTFVIPRQEKVAGFTRLIESQSGQTHIVVYLSSVYQEDALKRCIEALQENANVLGVSVKPHPRANHEFLNSIRDVRVYDTIPSDDHVAVVPNSSVLIELLETGIPVFQLFNLDNVDRDYYGFVREGIAPEISVEDLRKPFWVSRFYDEQWVSRFAAYSPAVDDSWRAAVPALMARMEAILRPVE